MKVTILIFCLITLLFSETVLTKDYNGFIFPKEYELMPLDLNGEKLERIDLTEEHIQNVEILLTGFLETKNIKIHSKLPNYKRQYFGMKNSLGETIVYINAITPFEENDKRWKKELYIVKDGGDNFFSIQININTEECFNFWINGEA